jgi:hypothetical protein
MIKLEILYVNALIYPGIVTAEAKTPQSKAPALPLPQYLSYDRALLEMVNRGVTDETGKIKDGKAPEFLPRLTEDEASDLLRTYRAPHDILTKDRFYLFDLFLPDLLMEVLAPFLIPFTLSMTGGAVYAYLNKDFLKKVLDPLDPELFASLPEECLAFNQTPNDYDYRIHLNGNFTYEHFAQLKLNIINALMIRLFGNGPFDEAQYKYVFDNCFKKFHIEFNEQTNNKFLIVTLTDGRHTVDLLFCSELQRSYLFTDNSLSIFFPPAGWTYGTPSLTPIGGTGNGHQAILHKIAKIIDTDNIPTINFKGWFALLCQQAAFYRCYVEQLEQNLLMITINHALKQKDPFYWMFEVLQQSLRDHLNQTDDPVALVCLMLSACRSLSNYGHSTFAGKLYSKSQSSFPSEGLPALFINNPTHNLPFALLQLFGLLAHDGKTVCYTLNEFKPALQFILPGREKTFTLLMPLDIPAALKTFGKEINSACTDHFFNYFFPSKESSFAAVPLEADLPNFENRLEDHRLYFYLFIWQSVQKGNYCQIEKILSAFLKHYEQKPSDHLISITERFFQGCLKNPSFSFGIHKGADFKTALTASLLTANLTHQALALWMGQSKEKTLELIAKTSNTTAKLKLLKQVQDQIDSEELMKQVAALIPSIRYSSDKIALLNEVSALILPLPPPSNDNALRALSSLIDLYLETFEAHPDLQSLLAKIESNKDLAAKMYLKTANHLLKEHPEEAQKIWQAGRKFFTENQEADLLCRLILRFIENEAHKEAGLLLPHLNRKLIGKGEQKKIASFIEQHGEDPEYGFALMCLELDRYMQDGQTALLTKTLTKLFHLFSGEEQKKEFLPRFKKLLGQPKQKTLCLPLLQEPKIDQLLTPAELLQEISSTDKNSPLLEKGIAIFPTKDSKVDLAFIEMLLRKIHSLPERLTPLVLELNDQALIEKWLNGVAELQHLQKALELRLPNLSPQLRKFTTKETLLAYNKEYIAYIPLVSEEERIHWITLILEAGLNKNFPMIAWMEKMTLTIPLLTLCAANTWDQEEQSALQRLIRATPYQTSQLKEVVSVYHQFAMIKEDEIVHFLTLSFDQTCLELKKELWEHFQRLNTLEEGAWLLAIKLLKQINSEQLFAFIANKSLLPKNTAVYDAVAHAARSLIKDPKNEISRLTALLHWRDDCNLPVDLELLRLCADSGHTPLLEESLARLNALLVQSPGRIGDLLTVLESILKKLPAKIEKTVLDLLNSLLSNISKLEMNDKHHQVLARALSSTPNELLLSEGCQLIYSLLARGRDPGVKIIAPCFRHCINSSNKELHKITLRCLIHPNLPNFPEKDGLSLDLMEKWFSDLDNFHVEETHTFFHNCFPANAISPEKERRCLLLYAENCINQKAVDPYVCFWRLLQKLVLRKESMTKQSYGYYCNVGFDPSPINVKKLQSNPKDILYETVTLAMNKLLNCSPAWLDDQQELYRLFRKNLEYLVANYSENDLTLSPLIHKWLTFQLPSGLDLSSQFLIDNAQLISLACTKHGMFTHHFVELLELSLLNAFQLNRSKPNEEITALSNTLIRLSSHPSPMGPLYACKVLIANFEQFCDLNLGVLLTSIENGILKNPEFNTITLEYMTALFTLSARLPDLASFHFLQFYNKLCTVLEKNPSLNLSKVLISVLDQGLACSLIDPKSAAYTEFLNVLGEIGTSAGLKTFLVQLLPLTLIGENSDELKVKIISYLKEKIPVLQEYFAEESEISPSQVCKVMELLKDLT